MSSPKKNENEKQGEKKNDEFYRYFEKEFKWQGDRDLPEPPKSTDHLFWRDSSRSN